MKQNIVSCQCVDPDPFECLAKKYTTRLSMAHCMDGCNCRCHTPTPGMLITNEQWQANKQRMTRPVRPAREKAS